MFRVVLTSLHRLPEIWLAHYPALHGPWAHIEKPRQIHAGCAEREQLARLRRVFRPVCGGLARSSGRGQFRVFIGVKIRLGVTDGANSNAARRRLSRQPRALASARSTSDRASRQLLIGTQVDRLFLT